MGTEFLQFGTKNALFGDSINQVLFSYIAGKMSGHPMEFVAKDCAGNWKAQVSVNVVGIIDGDNNSTQFIKDRGEFTKIYK